MNMHIKQVILQLLETDSEKAFYDGLSSYLDAAYAYATPYEQELAVHNYRFLIQSMIIIII